MKENGKYFVTMVRYSGMENTDLLISEMVGYFDKLSDAQKKVENNCYDIHDGNYFNFCVIEKLSINNIYCDVLEEYWYEWDIKAKKYILVAKPKALEQYVEFTKVNFHKRGEK